MTTTQSITHAGAEDVITAACPSLRKVDKARATREHITDDFEHVKTKVLLDSKRSKTTVNQVHPIKADVIIVSKSDNEHIVVTMNELFPLLSKQHAIHKWECAAVSSKKVCDEHGPWLSTEHLNDAVEDAVIRAQDATEFKARQVEARNKMFAFKEELDAV
tara:strand:- start:646 stop:1128 length:483 start_codon:yes stop_codon:yes gene_type:complete